MNRLSVVIPNYNYGRYVGAAISSALAVEWPDVEVIVVDDGSLDDSWAVIESFGAQITALRQPNAGPRTACNRGFAATTGDVVIFLDSDDVLDPSVAREVAAVWRPGISKVQFQMRRIDGEGHDLGSVIPALDAVPTPGQIRHWMASTSAYPTPPGSGNAYARDFLDRLFPLDDRCGDATDSACLAAAPFLGEVVCIGKPLVGYRVHGENRSNLLVDPTRFTRQVERALQRHAFAQQIRGAGESRRWLRPLFRGRHLLQLRIAQYRLCAGTRPIPSDGPGRMLRDCFTAVLAPGPEPISRRLLGSAWGIAALTSPRPVAHWLITRRFDHRGRTRSRTGARSA